MTRVEKYRRYRNEISNMKFETFTTKRQAAKEIDKLHDSSLGNKLNYEQVMEVHEVYDGGEVRLKRRKLICLTKYEIFYCLISVVLLAIIITALILVGTKLWG